MIAKKASLLTTLWSSQDGRIKRDISVKETHNILLLSPVLELIFLILQIMTTARFGEISTKQFPPRPNEIGNIRRFLVQESEFYPPTSGEGMIAYEDDKCSTSRDEEPRFRQFPLVPNTRE